MNITNNQDKTLPGVECSAYTCKYNSGTKGCHAKRIDVNASNAITPDETACGTFKLK